MSPAALIAEWRRCGALRQADIDLFKADGVPVLALGLGPNMQGFGLARDRVVVDGRRFEFARYAGESDDVRSAYVAVSLDRWGGPVDLVAFRPRRGPVVASWLGRAGLLGEERLEDWRLGDPLEVHPDPLAWLRAGREGVCIVDPPIAGLILRDDAGPIAVSSHSERRRLLDAMAPRLPRVLVRDAGRRAAA